MWQAYHSVSTVQEALQLLQEHQQAARIVAGATDLIIEMEQGQRPQLQVLVDITRVPGLDDIVLRGDSIELGPLVSHNHVVASDIIRRHALPLAQASWEVGAPQIRNRATIAGNLVTASPANDTITALIALGAELSLLSLSGERRMPLEAFYSGFRETVLRPDELLRAIHIPAQSPADRGIFLKLGLRRAQAISVVDVAAVLRLDGDTVQQARIALGSVAATIVRAHAAERSLQGQPLSPDRIAAAAAHAAASVQPIDDLRGSADYRQEMVRVLVARALEQLNQGQPQNLPALPPMLWGRHAARVTRPLPNAYVHTHSSPITCRVNGEERSSYSGQGKSLLHWLREDLRLPGTKEGCAEGECGACTVFLDDVAVMACMVHAPRAHGADIRTIEGLQQGETLHPLQQAFIDQAAVQCGFCTPGLLMAGAKLLEEHPQPSTEQINYSISGNLCRCTGYSKIVAAFQQASQTKA